MSEQMSIGGNGRSDDVFKKKLYPWAGQFQPFLVGGAGFAEIDIPAGGSLSIDGAIYRLGGGMDLYFAKRFAAVVGADYISTFGDINDTDIVEIKLGVQFKF